MLCAQELNPCCWANLPHKTYAISGECRQIPEVDGLASLCSLLLQPFPGFLQPSFNLPRSSLCRPTIFIFSRLPWPLAAG